MERFGAINHQQKELVIIGEVEVLIPAVAVPIPAVLKSNRSLFPEHPRKHGLPFLKKERKKKRKKKEKKKEKKKKKKKLHTQI